MKNVLMVCIALFLMYCQPEEKKDKAIAVETDSIKLLLEYAIIEPDSSQLEHRFTDYDKEIALTEQDLKQIERIIGQAHVEASKKGENITVKPSHLHLWRRQYIPYQNKKGDRIVWVNAFCHAPQRTVENSIEELTLEEWDWKNGNEIIEVKDGGSCYWNILINLDTGENELVFNGQA